MTVSVSDYEPVNSLIALLTAMDKDGGKDGQLSYAITSGNTEYFKLDKVSNNQVRVVIKHSPIEPNEYMIKVKVTDNGNPSKSDTATVIVTVIASGEINCNETIFGKK